MGRTSRRRAVRSPELVETYVVSGQMYKDDPHILLTFLCQFGFPLQVRLQSYSVHATIDLEVMGILSELFWSHVILDNTIKFRWNGIVNWQLYVSRGLGRLFLPSI